MTNTTVKQSFIPKLRFPEFSWEWEEKELNKLINPIIRKIPKPNSEYLALWIRSHFKWLFHKPNSDPSKIAMDELYVVKNNDLVVNITFAWEWAMAIASERDEWWLVSHRFPTYEFNKYLNVNFFRYIYPTNKTKYKLESISPGWAWRNRVMNKWDFLLLKFTIPNNQIEQQKIADFLLLIDKKIENFKTKKEQLEKYKKWVMQKIFSQEIRFKDENGNEFEEWEEKEFSQCLESISTKRFQVLNTEILWEWNYRVIDQGKNMIAWYSNNEEKVFNNPPVIIFWDHTRALKYIDFDFVVWADGTKILKNINWDLKYLFYFLSFNEIESEGYKRHFSVLKELVIYIPNDKDEQEKIADFLSDIDKRIEKEVLKLENAQKFKKGLLQQMFI